MERWMEEGTGKRRVYKMPESPGKAKPKLSKQEAAEKKARKAKSKPKSASKPKSGTKPKRSSSAPPKVKKTKRASPSPERKKRRVIKDVHRVAQTAALAKLLAAEKKRSQRERLEALHKRTTEPDYKKLKVAAKYGLPMDGFYPGARRGRAGGFGRYRASTFPDARRDIEKIVEEKLKKATAAKSSSSSSSSDSARNTPIPFTGASAKASDDIKERLRRVRERAEQARAGDQARQEEYSVREGFEEGRE